MMRQSVLRANRLIPTARAFSSSARAMAEGDTGSPRSGGARQSDAFTTREKASEDLYVRQQEVRKLEELKKKVNEQKKSLEQLDQNLDKLIDNANQESANSGKKQ